MSRTKDGPKWHDETRILFVQKLVAVRDARHLLGVVQMMADTPIATVNRHYVDFDEDTLREIIEGLAIPEVADVYGSFRLPLAS